MESTYLLNKLNELNKQPTFFIFEFVKEDKKYGLIVYNLKKKVDNININNELLFLSVTLKYKNDDYNIDLNKPVNYYVQSNYILNPNFVNYYAYEYLNINLTDTYEIEIMDKNLEIINLTKNDHINVIDGSYKVEHCNSEEENEIKELIEEIVEQFEISDQETNLQISITENSSETSLETSLETNFSPVSTNPSPLSTRITKNYSNRKCGICKEVGHTRKKCPKVVLPF